ncbi:MAG: signal peptidase II [bacterium]|nr:signal peptidase II [bacterium]
MNYRMPSFIITVTIFLLDQISKSIIRYQLSEGERVAFFKDILCITYVKNKGMVFGLFPHAYYFFTILSFLVIISFIIIIWRRLVTNRLFTIACSLILGGAAGNLFDRVFRDGVIDFIDIGWKGFRYPAFNLADIVICIGVGIITLNLLKKPRRT